MDEYAHQYSSFSTGTPKQENPENNKMEFTDSDNFSLDEEDYCEIIDEPQECSTSTDIQDVSSGDFVNSVYDASTTINVIRCIDKSGMVTNLYVREGEGYRSYYTDTKHRMMVFRCTRCLPLNCYVNIKFIQTDGKNILMTSTRAHHDACKVRSWSEIAKRMTSTWIAKEIHPILPDTPVLWGGHWQTSKQQPPRIVSSENSTFKPVEFIAITDKAANLSRLFLFSDCKSKVRCYSTDQRPRKQKTTFSCDHCSTCRSNVSLIITRSGERKLFSADEHAQSCQPQSWASVFAQFMHLATQLTEKTIRQTAIFIVSRAEKRKTRMDAMIENSPAKKNLSSERFPNSREGNPVRLEGIPACVQSILDSRLPDPNDAGLTQTKSTYSMTKVVTPSNAVSKSIPDAASDILVVNVPTETWLLAVCRSLNVPYNRSDVFGFWADVSVTHISDRVFPQLPRVTATSDWEGLAAYLTGRRSDFAAIRHYFTKSNSAIKLQQVHLQQFADEFKCTVVLFRIYSSKLVLGCGTPVLVFAESTDSSIQSVTRVVAS